VPGSVHTDLLALDRIPDPFVADNELHVQWVAEHDWEYRLVFQVGPEMLAEEHVFLVCDGLDTLTDPELRYTIGETDGIITVDVTAQRPARFVWLEIEGADAVFSDNYFDLPAKRTTTVTLPAIEGWSLDRVRQALRMRSLVDSF
jgi:hypothetical protein